MELRPYQQELLRRVESALAAKPKARVMMQLPTGGGKTVVAATLLAERLNADTKSVWLTHRNELMAQTCKMLTEANVSAAHDMGWNADDPAPSKARHVTILTAQKVGRRNRRGAIWDKYNPDDLLVIDEAHHAAADSWERAIRAWPGPVLGMTATPWRLSKKEGFDHLFNELLCGPQVAALQASGWLCNSRVIQPSRDFRIIGGDLDRTGDYTEAGIEQANRHHPNVMTVGVVHLWRQHAEGRPTIAYAVSVRHGRNLAAAFENNGIPAACLLGDTPSESRTRIIDDFGSGKLTVLVNVQIATEGFDLPDASCIIMTRPTLSLALYMQMGGRGLRPKGDAGDCIILDPAFNKANHGLLDDNHKWSLKPRGDPEPGGPPVVQCPHCAMSSPASSHQCVHCGYELGKDCDRCGKWRTQKLWQFENSCGKIHQTVCDLCHIDAHIAAHLPVLTPINALTDLIYPDGDDDMPSIDDDVTLNLVAALRHFVAQEIVAADGGAGHRRQKLQQLIAERKRILGDDHARSVAFNGYIEEHFRDGQLPLAAIGEIYIKWKKQLNEELRQWENELEDLGDNIIDKQQVFDSARHKVLHLLRRAAQAAGLLSLGPPPGPPHDPDGPQSIHVFIEARNCNAQGIYKNDGKLVVLKGSTAAAAIARNYPDIRKLHERLLYDGVIQNTGSGFRFATDYECSSPSQASSVVFGYPTNGNLVWKDRNGKPLGEVVPLGWTGRRRKYQVVPENRTGC